MSSSVERKRIRKSPTARRAEIVASAASIALSEGLEAITLRRIGEELAVRPGLVSHYFPSVEELVAEAFGTAATAELDALIPAERPDGTPTEHLARFLARTTGDPAWDDISALWINARHLSRYRPALREQVARQEADWRARLTGLITDGVDRGEFRTPAPVVVALQILVVLDGLSADGTLTPDEVPPQVARMAITTAERELSLAQGTLAPL
ncbi:MULTISPECIES: TetR family transcriptional regulator C-terminal domain-containing protein [unclassified Streptomyces]|uniref:TetR/AcrR family transcriptional regulator n=1 Tax=Streptomyces sp. SID8367 TaxID=2690349 RepID=UPI000DBA0D32|nr:MULTISPECIES: TetR family transcriptional regulator C-terminal domain-containing protein [unclassified Streptomyces]MYT74475.1 TetR family transcriptional regulator [Streptomyces sp. SID8367]RAJ91454.1 TetR family transcriptional regulator [Streptomyces sp. PsTaAH-137]